MESIKKFLTACQQAKRITEILPGLPDGLSPSHIRVIDTIHCLSEKGQPVKISDISKELKVTAPSITRLINELEAKHVLTKNQEQVDKRVTSLTLTTSGQTYYQIYVKEYHAQLALLFSSISEQAIQTTAATIFQAYEIMKGQETKLHTS